MTKEFVPYAQAVALKELGFNESCFGYYNIDPQLKCPAFNLVKPFDHEWCLPAPLYQQAFRWFREKHGLRHFIEYDYGYYIALIQPPLVYSYGETYEEAELACLKKLIEIVKEKK